MSTEKIVNSKRFKIAKKLIGEGVTVKVENKEGITFTYEHDAVYKKNKARFDAMNCFNKYGIYTKTKGFPTFARELVTIAPAAAE